MYIIYVYVRVWFINHSSTCMTQIDTNSPFYRSGPPAQSPAVPFAEQLPAGCHDVWDVPNHEAEPRDVQLRMQHQITHVVCFLPENLENFGKTPNPLPLSPSPSLRSVRVRASSWPDQSQECNRTHWSIMLPLAKLPSLAGQSGIFKHSKLQQVFCWLVPIHLSSVNFGIHSQLSIKGALDLY